MLEEEKRSLLPDSSLRVSRIGARWRKGGGAEIQANDTVVPLQRGKLEKFLKRLTTRKISGHFGHLYRGILWKKEENKTVRDRARPRDC